MSPTSPNSPEKSRNGAVIWIGALVVVLLLALVAIVASRGGSDGDSADGSNGGASDNTTAVSVPTSTDPGSAPVLPAYDAYADPDPAVGTTIPTVTGKDFAGDDLTIGPDDGKAKIILFVAHWCPHCQREVPLLKAHLDDNPMPDDVELLTVSTAVKPGAENYPPQEWLEKEGWEAPVLADTDGYVANDFGLTSFPYFVVVDADGKVVERASGELSTDQFDAMVEAAQNGQA